MDTPHTAVPHEGMEIMIPGTFVVLHGNWGDQMRNTIDRCPPLPSTWPPSPDVVTTEEEYAMVAAEEPAATSERTSSQSSSPPHTIEVPDGWQSIQSQPATSNIETPATTAAPTAPEPTVGELTSTLGGLSAFADPPDNPDVNDSAVSQSSPPSSRTTPPPRSTSSSFLAPTLNAEAQSIVQEWTRSCRDHELERRREWRESIAADQQLWQQQQQQSPHLPRSQPSPDPLMSRTTTRDREWWHVDGKVAVLKEPPTQISKDGGVLRSVLGSLSPGAMVVATELLFLDSATLKPLVVPPKSQTTSHLQGNLSSENGIVTNQHQQQVVYPTGRFGWICLVKVDNVCGGRSGYACLSLDGYPLMGPGWPAHYTDPDMWIWRVTYHEGAVVRRGLELTSQKCDVLPYGSLVQVTHATVISEGLRRLLIRAIVDEEVPPHQQQTSSWRTPIHQSRKSSKYTSRVVQGWCSESLNPQARLGGTILEPLPFPVPTLFRVIWPVGAIIHDGVEVSSSQCRVASRNSILPIVGRAFSAHPSYQCLERLRLAGDGGWITYRWGAPEDQKVVQVVGVDGAFDPDSPWLYHWDCTKDQMRLKQQPPQPVADDIHELSSVDSDEVSANPNITESQPQPVHKSEEVCILCLTNEKNAAIVHGGTGHVACCMQCSRELYIKREKCPICRQKIDRVIHLFWV